MKKINASIVFFFTASFLFSQSARVDSLKALLTKNMHDTTRMVILARIVQWSSNSKSKYTGLLKSLAEKNINNTANLPRVKHLAIEMLSSTYYNTGIELVNKAEFANALSTFEKCRLLNQKINDTVGIALADIQIASLYIKISNDYSRAIKTLYKVLGQLRSTNELSAIAQTYISIGRVYHLQKNTKKAIDAYDLGFLYFKKANLLMGQTQALLLVSKIYNDESNFTEAIRYRQKLDELIKHSEDIKTMPLQEIYYENLGALNYLKNDLNAALLNTQKSIALLKENNTWISVPARYLTIARIYQKKKQYQKAIQYASEALDVSNNMKFLQVKLKAELLLYELYKTTGNLPEALKMYEEYTLMKDSLEQKKNERAVIEAGLNYEFQKKELLARLKQEKTINTLKLEAGIKNAHNNTVLLMLSSGLLLIITCSVFLFKYFRQKNIIQGQKNNLLKQKLLLSQINPHFIFNSLNAIQNYIFKKNSLQAGIYLSQFSEMIRMVLDFSRKDYITLQQELNFLNNYIELQGLRFENKFKYALTIAETIDPETTLVPPMMAQPFIENAIEHGILYKNDQGNISVTITKTNNTLIYTVEDDGIGLEASKQLKVKIRNHKSLAMTITGERIQTLFSHTKKKPLVELIDKKDLNSNTTGVKVKFAIPFKEKFI